MTQGLRAMTQADLPQVLAWRNADDVRRNMYTCHVIEPAEHERWWHAQSVNPAARLLIYELDGQPLGVVTFSGYTGPGGVASWAFYSGERGRRGIGKMMELAALEYAFETLGVRKLECEVLSFNRAVVDFHVRHGFSIEGVFRDAYERDGELFDIYRLSMLATEWKRFVRPHFQAPGCELPMQVGQSMAFPLDLSPAAVSAYAEATRDLNPVHSDEAFAKAHGFPGRIAHGMLVGGELSRIFASEFPGPGTIYVSQTMDFTAPLLVGVPAEIDLTLKSRIGRRLNLETVARQQGRVCVTGTAILLAPKVLASKESKGAE